MNPIDNIPARATVRHILREHPENESTNNRRVAYLGQEALDQLGIAPNTQIRVVGPLQPTTDPMPELSLSEQLAVFGIDPEAEIEPELRVIPELPESQLPAIEPRFQGMRRNVWNIPSSTSDEKGSFLPPSTISPTKNLTEEEYLTHLSQFAEAVLANSGSAQSEMSGPNLRITKSRNGSHIASIHNIIFEVNRISVSGIDIGRFGPDEIEEGNSWVVNMRCDRGLSSREVGGRWEIRYTGKNAKEALQRSYRALLAFKRCDHCDAIYNGAFGKYCHICLFSDYFTREKESIDCPVCQESTKDYMTLECRHRMCYPCAFKLPNPKRCPLCRTDVGF